ncbi:MAG: protein kinase [Sandaracinaceae bacterium]
MSSEGSGRSGFTEEIAFPGAREPERLGRYELLAPLGRGGMASVFLARLRGPVGFEKVVALKRIHPTLSKDPRFVDMFLDEARVAAALQHPNIAHVFELGNEGPVYFLAMEYLHGEHLGAVLARATARGELLPVELACWIVARIAEGLHYAHEATDPLGRPLSIIHRDVSPQNIFVTYAGNVKLTDFGVAKASTNQVETDTGTVKGKFAYMAPEQAFAETLDRRADVFALGTVLWEALSGKRLFRGRSDAETLMRVTRGEVPSLLALRPEVGEDRDAIVRCALALEPDGRFDTAGALARALLHQSGDVSADDLRAWMTERFATEEAHKRALVSQVGEVEEATSIGEPSISGVVPTGRSDAATRVEVPEAPTDSGPERIEPEPDDETDLIHASSATPTQELAPPPEKRGLADADAEVVEELSVAAIPGARSRGRVMAATGALLLALGTGGAVAWLAAEAESPSRAPGPIVGPAASPRDAPAPTAEEPPRGIDVEAIEPPAALEPSASASDERAPAPPPAVAHPAAGRRRTARAEPPAPSGPPGTVQVSIAPEHPGARYGWVRIGDVQRSLPAVITDVPPGVTTVTYRLGDGPERRTRVRVEPGGRATLRLPR